MSVFLLALCALTAPSSIGALHLRAHDTNDGSGSDAASQAKTFEEMSEHIMRADSFLQSVGGGMDPSASCTGTSTSGAVCDLDADTDYTADCVPGCTFGRGATTVPDPTGPTTSNGAAITDDSTLTTARKFSLCGKLPSYGNAKPKNYADAMPTFFNKVTKKREAKLYKSGDSVVFECLAGFTTDGSKDGTNTFDAKCTGGNVPYFAPGGVCMKASKCGAVPEIADATATTKVIPGAVEFACNPGYSLDGEKVVAGGTQKNALFTVKCIEFSGAYEAFKGKCKSYKFMASGPAIRMTTNVFEALFTVNCKGKLVDSFGKLTQGTVKTAPTVDCTTITTADAETSSGKSCGDLVKDIAAVFTAKNKALAKAKASPDREWFDKSKTDPNVDKESMAFCKEMWALTQKKMPDAAQLR